jgi:hypothetical protein
MSPLCPNTSSYTQSIGGFPFFISALDRNERSVSRSGHFTDGKISCHNGITTCMQLRAGLDAAKIDIAALDGNLTPVMKLTMSL